MEKDKLLIDIGLDLDTFQAHIKRLKKTSSEIHRLDIDLLLESTRKLYDKILKLEFEESETLKTIVLPETMPEAEIPEVSLSSQEIDTDTHPVKEVKNIVEEKEPADKPKKVEKKEVVEKDPITKEKTEEIILEFEEKPKSPKPAEKESDAEQVGELKEETEVEKTAFDLFSSNVEKTVADKLGISDDSSVAAKMQQTQISDLKQAIGINEKFLFINELFNGDLGRYNKVIDEFNELKNQQGVNTYLFEMKMQNQWSDDNDAYIKLKDLLDRKFG